ncbi:MAG TPA: hypothetical protein VF470_05005, partial [Sphingomicrobium sp.]
GVAHHFLFVGEVEIHEACSSQYPGQGRDTARLTSASARNGRYGQWENRASPRRSRSGSGQKKSGAPEGAPRVFQWYRLDQLPKR